MIKLPSCLSLNNKWKTKPDFCKRKESSNKQSNDHHKNYRRKVELYRNHDKSLDQFMTR